MEKAERFVRSYKKNLGIKGQLTGEEGDEELEETRENNQEEEENNQEEDQE